MKIQLAKFITLELRVGDVSELGGDLLIIGRNRVLHDYFSGDATDAYAALDVSSNGLHAHYPVKLMRSPTKGRFGAVLAYEWNPRSLEQDAGEEIRQSLILERDLRLILAKAFRVLRPASVTLTPFLHRGVDLQAEAMLRALKHSNRYAHARNSGPIHVEVVDLVSVDAFIRILDQD